MKHCNVVSEITVKPCGGRAVKRKFRYITNKKQTLSNSYFAEYLFKGRILSQFLMTIKELYPIKND
ncbi:hypothetical protein HZS_7967 [Henneguya salminicola]|nr:hypothetical protein HZS_7967 [Henneguya salminicola]